MKVINIIYFCSVIFVCTQASEIPIKHSDAKAVNPLKREEFDQLKKLTRAIFYEDFKPIIMQAYTKESLVKEDRINAILEQWLTKQNALYVTYGENDNENTEIAFLRNRLSKKICGVCIVMKNMMEQELWIKFLAVHKEHRRKGIGSELLITVLDKYKDMKTCQLAAFAYENESAQKFFEKHGFQKGSLVTIDQRFPNTHVLYSLDLQK